MPAERELDPSASVEEYLGHQVREARKKQGWTQRTLAEKVFSSTTRISEVEGGDLPDLDLALKLGKVLSLGDSPANLVKLAQQQTVLDYAKPYLRRQVDAQMIHAVSFVVPGLLQTPDYARELLLAGQAGDPRDIDSFVDQRMARQAVWDREDPPWMFVVLAEAALAQATVPQLERLLQTQELPNISIRVLPPRSGHVMGTTYVLTLPDGVRGAYTEGFLTGRYSEDSELVLRFQRLYDRYASSALTAEASSDRINEVLKRST